MKTEKLVERTSTRIVLPESKGEKYLIRLMGWEPGASTVEGSSADYPVDVIKRDFAEAFPKGTRIRANHDGFCEAGGDIRRIMAKTVDTPWAEADGMYAHATFAEEWTPWLQNFADVVGLSISAAGEYLQHENEDGDMEISRNEETGQPIVKRFLSAEESPYNSVDVVEAPGADGRIVARALESAQKHLEKLNVREMAHFAKGTIRENKTSEAIPPGTENKESALDPIVQEAIDKAAKDAAAATIEALRDAKAATPPAETKGEDVAEAAFKAGLSEGSRKAVYARVATGETVESAIEAEKAREAEIEERIAARQTNTLESSGFMSSFDESKANQKVGGVTEMTLSDFDEMIGAV